MQAVFEIVKNEDGPIQYPFSCFLQNNECREFYVDPHYHYDVELLYFYDGHADVFIGSENHGVKSGEMILINSNEIHAIAARKGMNTRYVCITINPSILYSGSSVFESKYVIPFTMKTQLDKRVFSAVELKKSFIPEIVNDIYNEYTKKEYGFEIAIHIDIYKIFLWLLRSWNSRGINTGDEFSILNKHSIERLQKLFEYVDAHYYEDITADTVTGICCIDYSYFSRQFKQITGKTFKEYLNYVRIMEAEKMLLTTSMNITEIAFRTGFSTTSYFIKVFRDLKDITPKEARALLKK
jgi:AraC-like DNA-binding protein/mannose-6-phosphate isomerase-like protein (cupin superfamily)